MSFLKSVKEEMRNVTWPTGEKLRKDVITVIQTTILFAVFFGIVDLGLQSLLQLLAK